MVIAITAAILAGITNIVSVAVTVPLTAIFVIVLLIFGFTFLLTNVRSMMTFVYFRKQNYFIVFGNGNSRVVFMPEDIKAVSVKPYSAANIKSGEHIYDEVRTIGMGSSAEVLVLDIVPHVDPLTGTMPKPSFFKRLTRANTAFQLIIWCPEIERLKHFFLEKRLDLAISSEQQVNHVVEIMPRQVIVQRRLTRFIMPAVAIVLSTIITGFIFTSTGKLATILASIFLVAVMIVVMTAYGRRTVVKTKLYSDRVSFQVGTISQFRLEYSQIQAVSCEVIEPLHKSTYNNFVYSVGLSRTTQAVNVYLGKFSEERVADALSKKQQPLEVVQIRCLRPQEIADALQLRLDAYRREQPARISEENSD
ncbi:hypothetical protein [Culicoidibacter larvae]|uniref:Uncharacterized protein n=1 Tax=Culicoidibacter larvae TaxID=2579976 RepID=A0A5R8QAL7_9FIRM|nr:hypothetical protein [Culicoidibacter larvae]TLG72907.1 hypothetical protein FEZ08_07620 [Culicoidibacter larvae]